MSVKLGVPSKGRLMEKTFDWFGQRGVKLGRAGSEREYAGFVQGLKTWSLSCSRLVKYRENWPQGASIWV